jgi:hypothetical protein
MREALRVLAMLVGAGALFLMQPQPGEAARRLVAGLEPVSVLAIAS